MPFSTDQLLNDFAVRSFRDIADGDYIVARMACRAEMVVQYLWASQQAIEKYLKCILLLERIPAKHVRHDLRAGLAAIKNSGKVVLHLTKRTQEFIDYLDENGTYRYLEVSHYAFGDELVKLDQAIWELRRFCTLAQEPRQAVWINGLPAPKVRLLGGYLEGIIDSPKHRAREALLWQNGFFGNRVRRAVRIRRWFRANNSPLYLNPQILDEVLKYVYLPKAVEAGYRAHKRP